MKYIYFIGANDQETEAQRQGIKDYLSQRGTLFSDCTVLTPEYSYSDPGYNAGILEIMNIIGIIMKSIRKKNFFINYN